MPGLPEAKGLLALMLFHRARQAARVDSKGDLVRLEDQDRSLWDSAAVEQASRYLAEARDQGEVGPYQLQAAIAGCHASAPTAGDTDWRGIAGLYGQLADLTGSPVVELNRAVAVAMADGPEEGLALMDGLGGHGRLGRLLLTSGSQGRHAAGDWASSPKRPPLTARLCHWWLPSPSAGSSRRAWPRSAPGSRS